VFEGESAEEFIGKEAEVGELPVARVMRRKASASSGQKAA